MIRVTGVNRNNLTCLKNKMFASDKGNRSFFWLITITIILWLLITLCVWFLGSNWSERGTIGDAFGASNALFSGLAFAGLLYTILLQRQELRNQRIDIANNRKALERSTALQAESQRALQQQVEQMHLTAKLNALNTIINYYNYQISNPGSTPETIEKARMKRRERIKYIDELIDGIQDSDIDDD